MFEAISRLFDRQPATRLRVRTELIAQKMVLGEDGKYHAEGQPRRVVRNKCVTTAYVTFLALMHKTDATTIGDFKYHDSGIGTGDEAAADTTLGTPWGGARDSGTQVANDNTYTSVATTTYNTSKAITEHGLFNASSTGTLMDRTKFAAINVEDTNQIQWTFVITFTAGG